MSMNPKYIINWKDEKTEGEAAWDGGKNPKWFKSHFYEVGEDVSSAGFISFRFFNEEDLICQAEVKVQDLVDRSGLEKWWDCEYQGERVGKVLIGQEHGKASEAEDTNDEVRTLKR